MLVQVQPMQKRVHTENKRPICWSDKSGWQIVACIELDLELVQSFEGSRHRCKANLAKMRSSLGNHSRIAAAEQR